METGFFDGEVGEVLFAVLEDGDAELFAPAAVVPVDEAAGGECRDDAADADGEEHEADFGLAVAVVFGEGDGGASAGEGVSIGF